MAMSISDSQACRRQDRRGQGTLFLEPPAGPFLEVPNLGGFLSPGELPRERHLNQAHSLFLHGLQLDYF